MRIILLIIAVVLILLILFGSRACTGCNSPGIKCEPIYLEYCV